MIKNAGLLCEYSSVIKTKCQQSLTVCHSVALNIMEVTKMLHINRTAVYISQCNKMQQKFNTVTVQYINSEQFNTIEFKYLSQAKNTN